MQGNILIAILFFCLCELDADQTISTKDFVHKLSASLEKSEKLHDLIEVYQDDLYGDVGFSDDKPVMSYLAVHSDMEKRNLPAEIEKIIKSAKKYLNSAFPQYQQKENMKHQMIWKCSMLSS